jgi:hypothetical protein
MWTREGLRALSRSLTRLGAERYSRATLQAHRRRITTPQSRRESCAFFLTTNDLCIWAHTPWSAARAARRRQLRP